MPLENNCYVENWILKSMSTTKKKKVNFKERIIHKRGTVKFKVGNGHITQGKLRVNYKGERVNFKLRKNGSQ